MADASRRLLRRLLSMKAIQNEKGGASAPPSMRSGAAMAQLGGGPMQSFGMVLSTAGIDRM